MPVSGLVRRILRHRERRVTLTSCENFVVVACGRKPLLAAPSRWILIGLCLQAVLLLAGQHGVLAVSCPGGVLNAYDCDAPLTSSCHAACPSDAPLDAFCKHGCDAYVDSLSLCRTACESFCVGGVCANGTFPANQAACHRGCQAMDQATFCCSGCVLDCGTLGACRMNATMQWCECNNASSATGPLCRDSSFTLKWRPVHKTLIMPGVRRVADYFGLSVAVTDSLFVVGTPNRDVGSITTQGVAHIYECDLTASYRSFTCAPPVQLTASDGDHTDNYGWSVAAHNSLIVVGAPLKDIAYVGADDGAAYVYHCPSAATCTAALRITAASPATSAAFGFVVAVHNGLVAVRSNANGGTVHLFDCSVVAAAVACTAGTTLSLPAGAANEQFGMALAVHAALVVVGAPAADIGTSVDQGAIYVYDCPTAQSCSASVQITAPDGAAGDSFGHAVAVDGSRVVVGAPYSNVGNNTAQGAAYLFDCPTASSCSFGSRLVAFGGGAQDSFGHSVAAHDAFVVVGAPRADHDTGAGGDRGLAYLFECPSARACAGGSLRVYYSGGSDNDRFGTSVAVHGTLVAVGAPMTDLDQYPAGGGAPYRVADAGAAHLLRACHRGRFGADCSLTCPTTCAVDCQDGFSSESTGCATCLSSAGSASPPLCDACAPGRASADGECVCQPGHYGPACTACPSACAAGSARACFDGLAGSGVCQTCPPGHFDANAAGGAAAPLLCEACQQPCAECDGPAQTDCTACNSTMLLFASECVHACPRGHYAAGAVCLACHAACAACDAAGAAACTDCAQGVYLLNGTCVAVCPDGTFADNDGGDGGGARECSPCTSPCATCAGPHNATCLSCAAPLVRASDGRCVVDCGPQKYDNGVTCAACDASCERCEGPAATDCTACRGGAFLKARACVGDCGDGFFVNGTACAACADGCARCTAAASCSLCEDAAAVIRGGACAAQCDDGMVADAQRVCVPLSAASAAMAVGAHGVAAAVILGVALLLALVLFPLAQRRHRDARNAALLALFLGVADVVADALFAAAAVAAEGWAALPVSAVVFVALPAAVNVGVAAAMLGGRFARDDSAYARGPQRRALVGAVALLAGAHAGILGLLCSRVGGRAALSAQWSDGNVALLEKCAAAVALVANAVQIVLQAVVLARGGAALVVVIAIATSIAMVLFSAGMLVRVRLAEGAGAGKAGSKFASHMALTGVAGGSAL